MPSAAKRKKDKEALDTAKRLAEQRGEEVEQLKQQETPEEREETNDKEADGDEEEEEDDDDGGETSPGATHGADDDGDYAGDDGDEGEDNEDDMHIMRQLLQGFRDQRVSSEDREALMRSAGGQFTDLLTQHWNEGSEPPAWLVSLFRPVANPASTPASTAAVTQLQNTVSSNSAVLKNLQGELSKLKSQFKQQQQPNDRGSSQGDTKRARTSGDVPLAACAAAKKGFRRDQHLDSGGGYAADDRVSDSEGKG
eukprot:g8287.t1